MKKYRILSTIICLITIFTSCEIVDQPGKILFTGEAQGTYYMVTYFAKDSLLHQKEIDSLLNAFDLSASIWVPESIISRVNNNDPSVVPDEHFRKIFNQSKRVWKSTDGAFDITIGPLVNAWGFGFKNKITIDAHVIDSLMKLVNFNAINLDKNHIVKDKPKIQIDYNAIAQGYSVDLLSGFLKSKGIDNYLIDIGGEVIAKGGKPNGDLWVVGIEKPAEEANSARSLNATISISDRAIATSGSYRKFYEKDGMRYSHTIDPKTGYPVQHSLLSATVLHDSASIADAYATALMVMGFEKSKAFLGKHPELDAYLIFSNKENNYETWATEGIRSLLKPEN